MWILRRAVEGSNDKDKSVYRLIVGEYLVGRKGCQIQVSNDQSVSRKHATITVKHGGNSHPRPAQVSIKDNSKFGTFVNDVKCEGCVELKDKDSVTFGTQGSSYRLEYEPLVIFTSCLDNSKKKTLKAHINKLGGYVVNEWQKESSHLVMDALSFTVKVIYALVNCCPIVKPSYFHDLVEGIDHNTLELPSVEKYMPPIKEDLIDPQKVSFQPNKARKSLFAGKLFLFLEKTQHKRLNEAITLAGGMSELKECGDIPEDDALLTDANTLVVSVDLKLKIPVDRETWIGHVGDVLTSCRRRPIPETEVGLAILHLSLKEYCNSSKEHVPRITKHIVSKSLCSMEAMSQRATESQNVSDISFPEKKPFPFPVDQSNQLHETRVSAKKTSQETKKRRQRINFPLASAMATRGLHSLGEQKNPRRSWSRGNSNDPILLACDTPLKETSSETKRRKLSSPVTDVTHVSQSEHFVTEESTDNIPAKNRSDQKRSQKMASLKLEKEESVKEECRNDIPGGANRREEAIPKPEITPISQSQGSMQMSEKDGDVFSDIPGGKKRRKLSVSKSDVPNTPRLSQNRNSPPEVKVHETPSPELTFESKRRKVVAKSDVTHISQTQRSFVEGFPGHSQVKDSSGAEICTTATSVSTPTSRISSKRSFKQENLTEKDSSEAESCVNATSVHTSARSKRSSKQEDFTENPFSSSDGAIEDSRTKNQKTRVPHMKDNTEYCEKSKTSENVSKNLRKSSTSCAEQFPNEDEDDPRVIPESDFDESPEGRDSPDKNPSNTTPRGSGWISKNRSRDGKSQNGQNCKRDVHKDMGDDAIEASDEASESSGRDVRKDHSQKLSALPGFISKQERSKEKKEIVVKQEDDVDLPRDVLCIEHVALIVKRSYIARKSRDVPKERQSDTKQKNMKRFRKQNFAGSGSGLPRIIGGSDLVAFSSRNKDVEDWFMEIQEMNRERDLEDQAADKLFQYEPSKRKNRR